jgi:hypothetical protein
LDSLPFKSRAILLLGLVPIFIALGVYSVTWSFIWDEGFHLVAAQLIAAGQRPYLDFCFPQTPLNAYVNAAILLTFGNHWRPVHVVAALYICVATWLVADFVQTRLPVARWRTPCALAAGVLFGLNYIVAKFGPAAQAYAIGMLFVTGAFRAALPAAKSRYVWFALLAGLCAGIASGSTLLTAPVALVLLIWLIISRTRIISVAAYLLGCAIPFAPVIWLYLQGPKQTIFNVIQYQALFRRTNWGDVNLHDMDALSSWINSPTSLILIALFAAALIFLFHEKESHWSLVRREFLLAAALGVALVIFISTAHPTFERYYCVSVPFFAILGALGVYAVGFRLAGPQRVWTACAVVIALGYGMFFRSVFDQRDDEHWSGYEEIAKQVQEVTPLGSRLYADELVYFLLQWTPPEGMAFSYSQRLNLRPSDEQMMHIVSQSELKQQVQSGKFFTLQTCRDNILDDYEPAKYFKRHEEPADCDVFWDPKAPKASGGER